MSRGILGNLIGCLSISCSLLFWVLLVCERFIGHFPLLPDLNFNGWVVIWAFGLLFALVATALGSKRWLFAAMLPVITFFSTIAIVNSRPF